MSGLGIFLTAVLSTAPLQSKAPAPPPKAPAAPAAAKPKAAMPTAEEIKAAIAVDPEAVKLYARVEEVEATFTQAKNEDTRKAVVQAHVNFGERVMLETKAPETVRYLVAYKSYKRAQELDARNEIARGRIMTIVNIYYSWNRPLP